MAIWLKLSTLILLSLYALNKKLQKKLQSFYKCVYSHFTKIEKPTVYNWEYYYVQGGQGRCGGFYGSRESASPGPH